MAERSSDKALPDLPIRACARALRDALSRGHVVLTAEPGSGKTTLVPLLLLDEDWLEGRKILMLEPRRPAARMAARRLASLYGCEPGAEVGYRVRFERKVSRRTRIEVLTEGLLIRRLQADPELAGVGLVIFDEFHERNLQADLSLSLSLDVAAGLRDDLRLLVMSASLDPGPLLQLMPAEQVGAPGRCFPVDLHYGEAEASLRDPVPACVQALRSALDRVDGDVLVFLPGRREIENMRRAIAERWSDGLKVDLLFGDLPTKTQDAVLRPGDRRGRRVILSTDIAETSLTIEGIDAVVDSGLARRPAFDPNTGLTRLDTRWVSKASALQRAGRAGRLGPGHCFRAWTAARQARLPDWTSPEIGDADLAPLVLELANWGVTDADHLPWVDPPPRPAWAQAVALLRLLGALEADGRISVTGQAMVRIPAHPRLAHLVTEGAGNRLATEVAAVLSERDSWRPTSGGPRLADIGARVDALEAMRRGEALPNGFDAAVMRQIDRVARQFSELLGQRRQGDSLAMSIGVCVALAYPDRVAMVSPSDPCRYLMRNGRAALLDGSDALCGHAFLAVAGVDAGSRDGYIHLAAPLDGDELRECFRRDIVYEREVRWDSDRKDVVARELVRLGALTLEERAVPLTAQDPVGEVLLDAVRQQGLGRFFEGADMLRARVRLMRRLEPDAGWPDYSDAGLLDTLGDWLVPWLREGEGARQFRALKLEEMLASHLGWEAGQTIDKQLPTHFSTPAGTRRGIDYAQDPPGLALPLQEMLGEAEGPVLAGGRVRPVLHLLSPAGRPLQLTQDLAAFWHGAYSDVKKEMRGRYPKHHWPDDPVNAKATRFTKRRQR